MKQLINYLPHCCCIASAAILDLIEPEIAPFYLPTLKTPSYRIKQWIGSNWIGSPPSEISPFEIRYITRVHF